MADGTSLDDAYVTFYAEKIWRLLPAIYRTRDVGSAPGGAGPLREMVERIAVQVAVVRRSIDRLWDDAFIETCDDWVIPYIGELLATRLLAFMDARAQRLDVAKTIYYRRRAGTVGLLEELASDVAGRDARVVEFFRRLARTRHQLDPEIGLVGRPVDPDRLPLPIAEGLVGRHSLTAAGGYADLRNCYAASRASTAFDEFASTADLRKGSQSSGWYNISHLGVFVWWLRGFEILASTPCEAAPPQQGRFTFDPTGRSIPLFASDRRSTRAFGERWVPPNEWELPVAIDRVLWQTVPDLLYPEAFSVGLVAGGAVANVPRTDLYLDPERGCFKFVASRPEATFAVSYHFGFTAEIGAGGFDPSVLSALDVEPPPGARLTSGAGLDAAIAAISGSTTVEFGDSSTFPGPAQSLQVPAGATVVLRALSQRRPLLRWPGAVPASWIIEGEGDAVLVLEGLWLQGAELVLTGSFASVQLRMVTLDPGTSDDPGQGRYFQRAIDDTPLRPVRVFVEGSVGRLVLERCVTGPVRARRGGSVERLEASDSIVQSLPTHGAGDGPVLDPALFAAQLKGSADPLARAFVDALSPEARAALQAYQPRTPPTAALAGALASTYAALHAALRAQLEAAYPLALADLALGFSSGEVALTRCTVLGPSLTHRMQASECIFDEPAIVEDPQHGCVRFTAYAQGSNLHQPFRSVATAPRAAIFVSRRFGEPEYARLSRDADARILDTAAGDTILEGAKNGSEMGAFALEHIALSKRGLALKFLEFVPLGVLPVWIDAD